MTVSYYGNIALLGFALLILSRVYRICSPAKLKQELQFIKRIASWNGCPKQVVFSLMKRFGKPTKDPTDNDNLTETNVSKPTLWFEMPYICQKGEQLLRGLKKKLSRCLKITNVQIRTRVTTTKLNIFTNVKDKVPKQNKSNIACEFTCQKCNNSYIGKTDRTLLERTKEHVYIDKESDINKHLHSCYGSENMTRQNQQRTK